MIEGVIKAYLYTQYNDDKHLQALVDAYNEFTQEVYEWLRDARLPVFVGGYNSGKQLRWIAKGIYGQDIPILKADKRGNRGPYNALEYNDMPYNSYKDIYDDTVINISDDLFKRVLTWNFYRGDGNRFTIPWLKRRVMRFLNGVDGTDIKNDQHWCVSVSVEEDGIEITIDTEQLPLNNNGQTVADDFSYVNFFKSAMESDILQVPIYQPVTVIIKG